MFVTLAGVALALVGAAMVGWGLMRQQPSPPTVPAPAAAPAPAETASESPGRGDTARSPRSTPERVEELGWSRPVRISIPKIGAASTLESLGLDADGVMTTPKNPDKAGWFAPGPPPGLIGAAVIAGHVTWDREPAVFFKLGDLRRGDRIAVDRADGVRATFAVTKTGQFGKDAFPTDAVYNQVHHAGLRLITCGGVYDEQSHRYRDNLIVWAELVDTETT